MIKLGYNIITEEAIEADLAVTGHLCCIGGTGSGKSMAILYIINNVFDYIRKEKCEVSLYICDFKKSGDYKKISNEFGEYAETTEIIECFYREFEITEEGCQTIKILLIDEYASYISWLSQIDKRKAEAIKTKLCSLLMLGRSRRTFVWVVQQRISSLLFPAATGAIDNFQINLGVGRLSVESRKTLFAGEHFEDQEFEEEYHPKIGQGIILIEGQSLQPIQIPYIEDKELLKALLRKKSKELHLI